MPLNLHAAYKYWLCACALFGLKDDDNFYAFMIADGSFKVDKKTNGKWSHLVNWTDTSFVKKGNYTMNVLEVRKVNGRWNFYANGNLLYSCNAQYFFGRNFGLYVEDKQRVTMKYIKVAQLYYPK